MAAIAHVFTIGYVANQLGEDEDWLHGSFSIDITVAFTQDGMTASSQPAADLGSPTKDPRADAPPPVKSPRVTPPRAALTGW